MDTTPQKQKQVVKKAKKKADALALGMQEASDKAFDAVEEGVEDAELALRERFEAARDMVEDVRDMAERAFHERPYLLPAATGALGLGVGVLIGSRLARMAMLAGAGALVSSALRTEIGKVGRSVLRDISKQLDASDPSDAADAADASETEEDERKAEPVV